MADLQEFLRRSAGQPFDWKTRHCAFWVADWIEEMRGADPVPEWRAHVRLGEKAWLRVIVEEGGMLALARKIADRLDLAEVSEPVPGDVVCFAYGDRQIMGIAVSHGRIAMKTPTGIQIDVAPVLGAWRLS